MPSTTSLAVCAWIAAAIPAAAAELVMVEEPGCPWCARFIAEIGPIYPKTDEARRAPLVRIDIREADRHIALERRVVFTPTFVLVEDGRELDRMEGYGGDEFFWVLLNRMLDTHLEDDKR